MNKILLHISLNKHQKLASNCSYNKSEFKTNSFIRLQVKLNRTVYVVQFYASTEFHIHDNAVV